MILKHHKYIEEYEYRVVNQCIHLTLYPEISNYFRSKCEYYLNSFTLNKYKLIHTEPKVREPKYFDNETILNCSKRVDFFLKKYNDKLFYIYRIVVDEMVYHMVYQPKIYFQ